VKHFKRYYKRVVALRTPICSVVAIILIGSALSHAQQTPPPSDPDRILALDPRWTVSLTTPAAAAPGFDQQMAYVPLQGGDMLAIDLNEGQVRWTVDLRTAFTPATGDGLVFVAIDELVVSLDQPTGRTLWRTPIGAPLSGPLFWDGGWVFASTTGGELVAMRAEDGAIVWRHPLGAAISVTPSTSEDRLYLALADKSLAAVDIETGQLLWQFALNEDATGLLATEDQLLVGTRANRLHSISLDRGRIRWSQRAGADVIGAPIADEDNIYFVAFDNVLRALSRRNGNLRWSRNLPSRPSGGVLRINDVVLVPFSTNDIGAYLVTTGAPAFTIQAVGELASSPFLRDDARVTEPRLIAMSREGALQGFAPRVEPPPAPLAELPGAKVGG
jgi:outer membrane protein assembly factor BamB